MYLLLNSLGVKCRFLTKKRKRKKRHESFLGHHLVRLQPRPPAYADLSLGGRQWVVKWPCALKLCTDWHVCTVRAGWLVAVGGLGGRWRR